MNEYQKQAMEFLEATKTTLEVIEAVPQKKPIWAEDVKVPKNTREMHGINYVVTLKNARGNYVFDFWGSIRDREMLAMAEEKPDATSPRFHHVAKFILEQTGQGIAYNWKTSRELANKVKEVIKPNAYDVLACLNPLYEETFEDFCASYGYDTDSIRALKTFEAVKEEDRQLRRLFTHEELEKLAEIN